MRDATRVIQAVFGEPDAGAPFLSGPVFASTYRHSGDPTDAPFTYGRTSNPTWAAYERALAELEGGPCLVFASGIAAVSALLCSTLRPGDVVVLPADGYYGGRALAEGFLAGVGVEVRLLRTSGEDHVQALEGARLLLLETPSNPGLDVCDIASLADAAHEAHALVAVDNSTATVLGQRPLSLGADFSVGSDTKALTGHSDILLGHVAVRDPSLLPALATWRSQVGAVAGPMETWLALRSLATVEVRLQRQCGSALTIATQLRNHPAVLRCRYPGLPEDTGHTLAARQMSLYGPVLNFTLADQEAAERWLSKVRLVIPATSFGGVHSTAERRARWASDDVPPGFIRLSVGLEDPADLLEDIVQALG
ncbi:MAG: cystathionine gamma-lyase [Nocardioidaceae bacterium]|jgi:cystathionine gamma-lyase|nr:cystathionine gamma-lyase [Nocardioidaceae bacterium]